MTGAGVLARRYKLVFFVPPSHLAVCKAAVFTAGAGCHPGSSKYTDRCWTTMGLGQFRPNELAKPHVGQAGKLKEITEARVETLVVNKDTLAKTIEALKKAHPYEEPAYEIYKLSKF